MGVLHGRDLLSSKFVTAVITDKSKRVYFVPIKNTIGDFFLAELNNQLYCFKITEICQYREKLTKQFQMAFYNTSHYRPITDKVDELAQFLNVNEMGRVNGMMSDVLKILGNRERQDKKKSTIPCGKCENCTSQEENKVCVNLKQPYHFKPHTVQELIDEITNYEKSKLSKVLPVGENRFNKQASSILNYLNELDIKEIVSPTRDISQYIEDDLKATDPQFPGVVLQTLMTLDHENKKVTNTPVSTSKQWLMPMLVVMMIAGLGMVVYILYDLGMFDDLMAITDSFSTIGEGVKGIDPRALQSASTTGSGCSDLDLQKKYPEPIQLKIAVENGSETCKLSPMMENMIKDLKVPQAAPTP